MSAGLNVTVRARGKVPVLQPHGMLTERTGTEVRRILAKVLVDHGRAVVDLNGFRVSRASCVTVFPAALDQCGGWPRARLVLYRADEAMARALAQQGVSALIPVCRMLSEAEEAIERRPTVVRARIRLPCDDLALDLARRLVRDTCPNWQVDPEFQQITELVVSELVDNAVRHARTAAALTLERGPRGLRVAVRDTAAWAGFAPPGPELRRPGRGLELVVRLTATWGVEMHPVGKTVWAAITETRQARAEPIRAPINATQWPSRVADDHLGFEGRV
ncbi:MAG TPA: ATP-binding protein [Pseudonocardiaceae bacterium]